MIYSFLSDEAFAVTRASASVMSVSDIQQYHLGILDDNLLNYFTKHSVITDPVGSSKALNRNNRVLVDKSVTGFHAVGRMYLNFDADRLGDEASTEESFINALTIDPDNDNASTVETKVEKRAALFNIIETIFFSRDVNTTVANESTITTTISEAINSTYAGCVIDADNPLILSSTVSRAIYKCGNDTDTKFIDASVDFYDFCEFSFKYGNNESDVVRIRVYLSSVEFKKNYPYSTITDIIYPCKPEWMLEPEFHANEVVAILQASSYKDTILDEAITSRDHSGMTVYKTRYVPKNISNNTPMGFGVLYKGAEPSSEAMREAIRGKLMNEINKTTQGKLATEEEWKSIFPDLFVDSGFYIFPCYYQRRKFGNNTIEQNISNYRTIYDRLKMIFSSGEFTDKELFDNAELIQAPGHGMYMVVFPVSIVNQTVTSLRTLHPTYQPLDSVGTVNALVPTSDTKYVHNKSYYKQDQEIPYQFDLLVPGADYQINVDIPTNVTVYEKQYIVEKDDWNTMTSSTKSFAWLLAHCIARCIDDSIVNTEFTEESIGTSVKRKYLSFVSNYTEYHVLTLEGAEDVFTPVTTTLEGEEHVPGYTH